MKKLTAEQLLHRKGLTTDDLRAMLSQRRVLPKVLHPRKTVEYKFAIVSDTHMCDKGHALAELHNFYSHCEKEGINELPNKTRFIVWLPDAERYLGAHSIFVKAAYGLAKKESTGNVINFDNIEVLEVK